MGRGHLIRNWKIGIPLHSFTNPPNDLPKIKEPSVSKTCKIIENSGCLDKTFDVSKHIKRNWKLNWEIER